MLLAAATTVAACGIEVAEAPREEMPEDLPPITAVRPTLPESEFGDLAEPDTTDGAVIEDTGFDPFWDRTVAHLLPIVQLEGAIDLRGRSGSLDLYVADKGGRIHRIERSFSSRTGAESLRLQSRLVLDLREQVSTGNEQGLLGFTFSSDGRRLYVSYTDLDGRSVLVEYPFSGERAQVDSGRVLLTVNQPFANHNGGDVHIGPDGFLYWSLGDGGGGGDPERTGQDPRDLLGSILRIDPTGTENAEYSPAPGNPFGPGEGAAEVWAYGIRNAWRFTFDSANGDLWIADVGQDELEEITHLPAEDGGGRGANLGWNAFEGTMPFRGGEEPDGEVVMPTVEYAHERNRCSVTGGVVVRDEALPSLDGIYLASDACSGELFGVESSAASRLAVLDVVTGDEESLGAVWSFGTDDDDQIYIIEADGTISRIVPPPAVDDDEG